MFPNGACEIFHQFNPSVHSVAMRSTQPLTKTRIRDTPWGVIMAGMYSWQPFPLDEPTVSKPRKPQPPAALGAYLGLYTESCTFCIKVSGLLPSVIPGRKPTFSGLVFVPSSGWITRQILVLKRWFIPRMTPGNNPETFIQNNNHGESLQSHSCTFTPKLCNFKLK